MKIFKTVKYHAFLLFILFPICLSAAELFSPVDMRNYFIYYLPHLFMPPESSSIVRPGYGEIHTSIVKSNTNIDKYYFMNAHKQGVIDVESSSLLISYKKNIGYGFEGKIILPFYYHGGGFMDMIIEDFHKAFPYPRGGLPNGGREYSQKNRIHIQYHNANGGMDINSPVYGIGDPSFYLTKSFRFDSFGIALSFGVKPYAGFRPLINSRTTDIGISSSFDYTLWRFYFFCMTGSSIFIGNGYMKKETDQVKDYIIFSAAGVGFRINSSVSAIVQIYAHTSIFKTGISRLDNITYCNSYAVKWNASDNLICQFYFSQDIITYATTDIDIGIQAGYRI